MVKFTLKSIKPESVTRVYSGRVRKCMCGCAGKYSHRRVVAGLGHEGEPSDRSVDAVVRTMNNLLETGLYAAEYDSAIDAVYFDTSARTYVAYFS